MPSLIKKIYKCLFNWGKTNISIKNIKDSTIGVKVYNNPKIISRPDFEVSEAWFDKLLTVFYDNEIKSKYRPDLHQSNELERTKLDDILDFNRYIGYHTSQIRICEDYINRFKKDYRHFGQIIKAEGINIISPPHPFLASITKLDNLTGSIENELAIVKKLMTQIQGRYGVLTQISNLNNIQFGNKNSIDFNKNDWPLFLDKEPSDNSVLYYVFKHHNQVYDELSSLNRLLSNFRATHSHKLIVGDAGTGKTHMSAHLVNRIKENKDFVLFFKSKLFSGDNINLNEKIFELLQIPKGYTINEVLEQLNEFAKSNDRRCFFIIDALNETTKSSIGFSNIWNFHLQDFMNQMKSYSHLYLVCTLRTSYLSHIWSVTPSFVEIKGFGNDKDIKAACKKYFEYYRITAVNLESADITIFKVPLLLDLYCRLINESRTDLKEISLDISTYLQIFENYINNLTKEVKDKLRLQKSRPIEAGFEKSSELFYSKNEALVTLDEFSDSFDNDDLVTQDRSVAKLVLEGYLIFIKDSNKDKKEYIKHTQQEIGGYLLAKKLSENYNHIEELLQDQHFKDKILGADQDKHHQLRLDILKFLIALRPEVVTKLKDEDSLRLSWWYVYNGYNPNNDNGILQHLLEMPRTNTSMEYILSFSLRHWLNQNHKFNFNFIAEILNKLDLWTFDLTWTFLIYKESEFFSNFVKHNIERLINNYVEKDSVIPKFIAYTTATTVRELRDQATIYLISYGKKNPMRLLELTKNSLNIPDIYIYERLVSCCYGVALILQNNNEFVENDLPKMAKTLFDLQCQKPVFNYIIIDSIKHLVDLAIYKKVFTLSKEEHLNLNNYFIQSSHEWIPPAKHIRELIDNSDRMSLPEPIGMDFGIYTIPRLIKDDYNEKEAISNVYKRIIELGFKANFETEALGVQFRDFYNGQNLQRSKGKVDRLGKKYSWKAFYDFAGVLLKQGKLNVFEDHSHGQIYQRLNDVEIDISMPNSDYKKSLRLYSQDLISNNGLNPVWYNEVKIDTIAPIFVHEFGGENYTMLYGLIEQRIDEEYSTRSYLLAETVFIKKNENFERASKAVDNQIFDWDADIHIPHSSLSKAYFGEFYWADNMVEYSDSSVSIPTGEAIIITRKLNIQDIFLSDNLNSQDIGKETNETHPKNFNFDSEPTLVEYLWESDNNVLKGNREYYPSINLGKELGLRPEPEKGKILDASLNECYHCIEYKDQRFENTFNYIRTDLLKSYMDKNNLALLYQVKQHSYNTSNHYRGLKLFIV